MAANIKNSVIHWIINMMTFANSRFSYLFGRMQSLEDALCEHIDSCGYSDALERYIKGMRRMTLQEQLTKFQTLVNEGKLDGTQPAFILIGQDMVAAETVRFWAHGARVAGSPDNMTDNAMAIALSMDAWPVKRVPGSPIEPAVVGEDDEIATP